jgi:predicted Zn-dependent protease
MRKIGVGVALAVFGIGLACATSPLGRSQLMLVGDAQMDQMGSQAFEQLKSEQKVSRDSAKNAYVGCVSRAITGALTGEDSGSWEVIVFDDDSANAFALPGRKIGVHTGLLNVAKNQDQLATVIGHEVAHVIAKHSAERVSDQIAVQGGAQIAGAVLGAAGDPSSPLHGLALGALGIGAQGVVLKFSRTHESEADVIGLKLMSQAGFDPRASVPLWQNMAAAGGARAPEFLSTHPAPATRIAELERRIPEYLPLMQQAHAQGRRPSCR